MTMTDEEKALMPILEDWEGAVVDSGNGEWSYTVWLGEHGPYLSNEGGWKSEEEATEARDEMLALLNGRPPSEEAVRWAARQAAQELDIWHKSLQRLRLDLEAIAPCLPGYSPLRKQLERIGTLHDRMEKHARVFYKLREGLEPPPPEE